MLLAILTLVISHLLVQLVKRTVGRGRPSVGGDLTFIEATKVPGRGNLIVTGTAGQDVRIRDGIGLGAPRGCACYFTAHHRHSFPASRQARDIRVPIVLFAAQRRSV